MYKPVILIGNGCRGNPQLVEHLCSMGIPVLVTWQGIDLVAEDCPSYCGRPGVFGMRAANIIQQKADSVYCFGARLDGEQTAYDFSRFAPKADKYVWDIDQAELDKLPAEWHRIKGDLNNFMIDLPIYVDPDWLAWARDIYARFRTELEADHLVNPDYIGTKELLSALNEASRPDDLIALASSSGAVNTFLQTWKVKKGQRITVCSSIGAMGADIPMAIGACMASGRRTIVITGDGGIQLNAQELEVIRRLDLPIKIFVFSNNGYNSIRAMQDVRFAGRHVGADPDSGFTIPPIQNLAKCYGIHYYEIINLGPSMKLAGEFMDQPHPVIFEIPIDPKWVQWPKVASSLQGTQYRVDAMENMSPYIDPDELRSIMEWGN